MTQQVILLTGASGFIGRSVLMQLSSLGLRTRVLTRDPVSQRRSNNVEHVTGDLSDRKLLARAVEGCDAVIHCASYVGPDPIRQQLGNVLGTANLAWAARIGAPVPLLYMSTSGVYGGSMGIGGAEGKIRTRPGSSLAVSRYQAELLVANYDGTIIRPNLVHGAGDRTAFLPLVQAMLQLDAWIGDRSAMVSAISVSTLAALTAALAMNAARPSGLYHAAMPQPVGMETLLTPIFRRLQRTPPTDTVSIDEALAVLGRQGVSRRQLMMVGQHNWYNSDKIWATTGLRPPRRAGMDDDAIAYYADQIAGVSRSS